jgi:hypothetical protein
VRSQDVLLSFGLGPLVVIADTAVPSDLVDPLDFLPVSGIVIAGVRRITKKESVVGVPGWMVLGLEQ